MGLRPVVVAALLPEGQQWSESDLDRVKAFLAREDFQDALAWHLKVNTPTVEEAMVLLKLHLVNTSG